MMEVTLYQKQRRSFFMVQSIPSVTSSNPQFAFSIIAFVSIDCMDHENLTDAKF
jgi:hypothetical protein